MILVAPCSHHGHLMLLIVDDDSATLYAVFTPRALVAPSHVPRLKRGPHGLPLPMHARQARCFRRGGVRPAVPGVHRGDVGWGRGGVGAGQGGRGRAHEWRVAQAAHEGVVEDRRKVER